MMVINSVLSFFSDPLWAIPLVIATVFGLLLPTFFIGALPLHWNDAQRSFAIRAIVVFIALTAFISMRLSLLALADQPLRIAELIVTGWVGVAFLLALPKLYDWLAPDKLKKAIGYQASVERVQKKRNPQMKVVRLNDGTRVLRPVDQPSGHGEETMFTIGEPTVPRDGAE